MRNSRRAGKPAGRKPEKQGLTGLFTKGKNIPTTAQQTLPYREMYRDGVCRVADRYYTKTIEYEDINYQLAQSEDQAAIFDGWSACLNYFDSSLPFQLSFLNHRSRPGSRYSVNIPMQDDDYNSVRCEYVEMLENQIAKSNNGIVRTKLLTFGVNVDDLPTARARLERVEADICGNFKKLGVKCRSLSGLERLELLHGQLHPGSGSPFRFSWDMIPKTGLSTKDFIAPDSFDFRFSRLFRVGTTWGAASYLQILASELSDKLLAELLEMDAEMTITLHIQTVDQAAADVLAVSVQRDTAIGKEQGQDLVHRGAVTDTGRPPGARHAEAPHGLVFDPCPGPQDRAAGPNTVVEDFQCDLRGGIIR